jgi:hypothetical protein
MPGRRTVNGSRGRATGRARGRGRGRGRGARRAPVKVTRSSTRAGTTHLLKKGIRTTKLAQDDFLARCHDLDGTVGIRNAGRNENHCLRDDIFCQDEQNARRASLPQKAATTKRPPMIKPIDQLRVTVSIQTQAMIAKQHEVDTLQARLNSLEDQNRQNASQRQQEQNQEREGQ